MSGAAPGSFDDFWAHVGDGSMFELVVRGHLYVEAELLLTLEEALPFPALADLDRFTFPQKVALAAAHGLLRADDKPAYSKLNALRNRLAHNLRSTPTPKDEAELVGCLGKDLRRYIDAAQATPKKSLEFPMGLRITVMAMCFQLRNNREVMREANEGLRASVQRLVDLADGPFDPP